MSQGRPRDEGHDPHNEETAKLGVAIGDQQRGRRTSRPASAPAWEGAVKARGTREFWCTVVSESVLIRLRRSDGFGPERGHFVQCNQTECQYVDENRPPCPLNVGMYAEEIRAIEAARIARDD